MTRFLLISGILLSFSSFGQKKSESPDFLKASVLHAEIGMDQINRGCISAGIKYLKWADIRFKSSNFYYGYNPWSSFHCARIQFDYTLYFPSAGLSALVVSDGDFTNVALRPQLGVFFVYANLYLGYNIWMGSQMRNNLSNWTISSYISIPFKRW